MHVVRITYYYDIEYKSNERTIFECQFQAK